MSIIVDKDAVRLEIMMAFQRCINEKPITNITLRDIASEAGMSHAKLLNYFEDKDDLIVSYVHYTREFIEIKGKEWFASHDRKDYESNLSYMNAFMEYVANGKVGEIRPNATVQTYVLARYNDKVRELVSEEYRAWRELIEKCMINVYGDEIGKKEAEAMMILVSGTFICNYNNVLTGNINDNIIGYLSNLSKS